LSNAHLTGAELVGCSLHGADLSRANLIRANLKSAKLHHAVLFQTSLLQARLVDAELNEAFLAGADFSNAIASGASFRRANLKTTNFCNTTLDGSDMELASCEFTTFARTDLSTTLGLETVQHVGPSTIGVDTLYLSQGKIPEAFLRGCGVPENLIKYLPSLIHSASPIDFYSCFISYSHADKSFARRLHDTLQGRGIRCWLDEHQILPGDDIYEQVDRGLRLWDKVLLCASEHSLNSWWVDREVDTAMEREMKLRKDRGKQTLLIIPLNLDGYLFEWEGKHAAELRKRLAPDFTAWGSDDAKIDAQQLENVVKALRADDGAREAPPVSKV
jgi:hypothetical protein